MSGSNPRKRKVTVEFPQAEEEASREWDTEANPTSRSKRKKVTVDFVGEEEELGRGKRKRRE